MAYCVKCGAKVDDDIRFCPQCGAEIPRQTSQEQQYTYGQQTGQEQQYTYGQQTDQKQQYTYDTEEYFDPQEVRGNKGMGILFYFGILVLIPLLAGDKRSQYVRFHANQGLVLFLVSSIIDLLDGDWVWGLHSVINFGESIFSWAFDILSFACFILMIMGIVAACKGQKKELPLIGKIKILK